MKHILTLLITLLSCQFLSAQCPDPFPDMPDEMLNHRFYVPDGKYNNPYTMFNRRVMEKYGLNVNDAVITIREKIRADFYKGPDYGPLFLAYSALVTQAKGDKPSDNGSGNESYSELAQWAKNNAFVFMIGLDENAAPMDTLGNVSTRNAYRDKAMDAFATLDVDVPWWGGDLKYTSRTLIMWL